MIFSIAMSSRFLVDLMNDRVGLPQLTTLNAEYRADHLPVTGLIMIGSFMAFFVSLASRTISIVRPPVDYNIRTHSTYEYINRKSNICVTTYPSCCQGEHFTKLRWLISLIKPVNPFRTRNSIEVDSERLHNKRIVKG